MCDCDFDELILWTDAILAPLACLLILRQTSLPTFQLHFFLFDDFSRKQGQKLPKHDISSFQGWFFLCQGVGHLWKEQ